MPNRNILLSWLALILPILAVLLLWFTDPRSTAPFVYDVPIVALLPFAEGLTYWKAHAFTFIPVFFLSFDPRVNFYKLWPKLVPSILAVGVFFVVWDICKTALGVWGFNTDRITGYLLNLPHEEYVFFFTIPYACLFIHEVTRYYGFTRWFSRLDRPISWTIAIVFWLVGIASWGKVYTCTTFLWAAGFQTWHLLRYPQCAYRPHFYVSFLFALLPFWIVDTALTGGFTTSPVVVYNPDEFLGIRLPSIPLEDFIYGYLLLFMVTALYEHRRLR